MEGGPSPFVPFLLVAGVTAAIWGPGVMNSASFLSDVQETTVSFVFVIPLIMLLGIYYVNESVLAPLIVMIIAYFVSRTLIGPLILVLLIHVISSTFFAGGNGGHGSSLPALGDQSNGDCEGWEGGFGWGSVWLLILFLIVNKWFIGF